MASVPGSPEKRYRRRLWIFYLAVRGLKPVWELEEMRKKGESYLQGDDQLEFYSPSEALLYAIVNNHQPYAEFLLSRYRGEALNEPIMPFCHFPASTLHLAMAVRYDRLDILGLILQEMHRVASGSSPDRAACFHSKDGRTPLHLACELCRPEAVVMLLGNGASPLVEDHNGLTPLDVTLEKLRDCKAGEQGARRQCLDNLLMFKPKLGWKMKAALDGEPELWSPLLGEDTYRYLTGRSPAPLLVSAMQTILQQLQPSSFPDSLHDLPIPSSLKPPGLPGRQRVQ